MDPSCNQDCPNGGWDADVAGDRMAPRARWNKAMTAMNGDRRASSSRSPCWRTARMRLRGIRGRVDESELDETKERITVPQATASHAETSTFVKNVHGIRYQAKDVARSVAFYTQRLGFKLEHQQLPAFASISLGGTQILLSGPGASGSRAMPNGDAQEPGGWNRVVLTVADCRLASPP